MPGDSKWPFHPLVGGHLTIWKGHLTIPKKVTKNCQVSFSFSQRDEWFPLRLWTNTPLEHTPKPSPTGYKGIPFIVGEGGIAWGVL